MSGPAHGTVVLIFEDISNHVSLHPGLSHIEYHTRNLGQT